MVGAVISTVILYSRWKRDFAQREMIERNRILNENRRLELQELSKRKEALGSRLATAINHLSSTNGFTQVAGLIELGGLADDWWNLGVAYGAIPDGESQSPDGEGVRERHDLTFEEVQQRRQEIVTLIFCQKLPGATDEDSICDEDRQNMVQRARADLLRVHTDRAYLISESSEPSLKSWHHFNLDGAWLKDAQLNRVYLRRTLLVGANLQNARLGGANVQDAQLGGANLQHANLAKAQLQHACLWDSRLQGSNLVNARLQGAELLRAKLHHARLRAARLHHAKLMRADVRQANLRNADLRDTDLLGAKLNNADVQNALYSKETVFPQGFKPGRHGLKLNYSRGGLMLRKADHRFPARTTTRDVNYEPSRDGLPGLCNFTKPVNRE